PGGRGTGMRRLGRDVSRVRPGGRRHVGARRWQVGEQAAQLLERRGAVHHLHAPLELFDLELVARERLAQGVDGPLPLARARTLAGPRRTLARARLGVRRPPRTRAVAAAPGGTVPRLPIVHDTLPGALPRPAGP